MARAAEILLHDAVQGQYGRVDRLRAAISDLGDSLVSCVAGRVDWL